MAAYTSHVNTWRTFCTLYRISEFALLECNILAFFEHDISVIGNKYSTIRGKMYGLQHHYGALFPWLNIPTMPKLRAYLRAIKRLQGGDVRDLREGLTSTGILRYLRSLKLTDEAGLVANALYKVC